MRRVASFLCIMGMVASCTVFDASMRSDPEDAGASSSGSPRRDASDDRSIAQPGVEDASGLDANDISDEPVHKRTCGWVLQDGTGASGCNDPEYTLAGPAYERERNDTDEQATMLERGFAMCGVVKAHRVDTFAFDVVADRCFHIDVDSDDDLLLDIEVRGPGVGVRTFPNNNRLELPGKATSAGRVFVVLRTPSVQGDADVSYKLAVR